MKRILFCHIIILIISILCVCRTAAQVYDGKVDIQDVSTRRVGRYWRGLPRWRDGLGNAAAAIATRSA